MDNTSKPVCTQFQNIYSKNEQKIKRGKDKSTIIGDSNTPLSMAERLSKPKGKKNDIDFNNITNKLRLLF